MDCDLCVMRRCQTVSSWLANSVIRSHDAHIPRRSCGCMTRNETFLDLLATSGARTTLKGRIPASPDIPCITATLPPDYTPFDEPAVVIARVLPLAIPSSLQLCLHRCSSSLSVELRVTLIVQQQLALLAWRTRT